MLFTLPALALLAVFVAVPLLQAVFYSFTDWDGSEARWIGLANYNQFFSNPEFQRIALNSVLLLVSVPVGMIGPFVTAYLLNAGMPGDRLIRTTIFAPTVLSWVIIGLVARSILADDGPVNNVLRAVGLGALAQNWLADPVWALVAVILAFNAAVFGVNTIIFLTGFATLDRSMIEAARVDGASAPRILISIVIPATRRFIEFVFIITIVVSFTGIFGLLYTMTAGGPGSSTTTLEFSVWQIAFASGDFGLAAAMGVSLMVITLTVIGAVRLYARRED